MGIVFLIGGAVLILLLVPLAVKMNRQMDGVITSLGPDLHRLWSQRMLELRAQGRPVDHMFKPPYYGLEPKLFHKPR